MSEEDAVVSPRHVRHHGHIQVLLEVRPLFEERRHLAGVAGLADEDIVNADHGVTSGELVWQRTL
jgi:hypothetical protein